MTRAWRAVTDEPVRGVSPPSWIFSLSGIERLRMWSRRMIPSPPFARLTGFQIGHISTGSVTGTLKASGHLVMLPGFNLTPAYNEAMLGAGWTAIDPGTYLEPVSISALYFRPPRSQPGSFLCRAHVLNASSVFVSCASEIEDPVGRLVGYATSQWAVRAVEPPPPPPPASVEPVEDATYTTPDPPDRPPVGGIPPLEMANRHTGLELSRMVIAGELPPFPVMVTFGARWVGAEEGSSRVAMPASEWFCSGIRNFVAPAAIESLCNIATTTAAVTLWAPGESVAILEANTHFVRTKVPADGRQLAGHGRVTHRAGKLVFLETEALDPEGSVVAVQTASLALLDPRERGPAEPERVLATLLFTDIVGSTQHAERMGDSAWRSLLGEHHALVRRELGAHRGREINTIGDGFLARFESPASAIRAAKAIRDGVRRLNLEVRASVHTGECEVDGADLAGIALHVASRIVGLAEPSEILVSQTVRDLAAGSGLRFATRGQHSLKGVEGEWNLFAVEG